MALLIHTGERLLGGVRRMLFPQEIFRCGVLPWVLCCLPTLGLCDAPSDSLLACTELTSDTARLACFDRAMQELKKNTSNEPPVTPEQKFGLSNGQVRELDAKQGSSPTPTAVHAHVVSVSRYMNERQVFVLDNVQSWQQVESDPYFTAQNGQEVTISNGLLGSFWLSTDPRHRTRVKRIR
jgi:hypothetical protein